MLPMLWVYSCRVKRQQYLQTAERQPSLLQRQQKRQQQQEEVIIAVAIMMVQIIPVMV
jgi:hypothetical protein